MATTKEFLNDFFAKIDGIQEVSVRAMMGAYVLYYKGKVIGGIYDDRVLIKPVDGLAALLPDARLEIPYGGAKPMVRVENFDKDLILQIFELLYAQLPQPKPKKKK